MGRVSPLLFVLGLLSSPVQAAVAPQGHLQGIAARPAASFEARDARRFDELVGLVVDAFRDTVAVYGGTLVKDADWGSDSVNATAYVRGDIWTIKAWGGLFFLTVRRPPRSLLLPCTEVVRFAVG